MIECAIPQNILKYKSKFIGNFSMRETIGLSLGAMTGLFFYFVVFAGLDTKPRIFASAIFAIPFLLFGFVQIFEQPLEKILGQIIFDNFICPTIRKNEIHYPEYEKYLKNGIEALNAENTEEDSKKKKKKSASKTEKKAIRSKQYKAIR